MAEKEPLRVMWSAPGVTGGLAADENAVFTPSGTTPLASYTAHGSLAVDGSVFTSPGVYHYLVTEASGDYEGMDYDNSTYDVYLYVYNSNNGLYVGKCSLSEKWRQS